MEIIVLDKKKPFHHMNLYKFILNHMEAIDYSKFE